VDARWLNGDLTRFCGNAMHDRCKGTISTIGIESPCLCKCHSSPDETAKSDAGRYWLNLSDPASVERLAATVHDVWGWCEDEPNGPSDADAHERLCVGGARALIAALVAEAAK
jgi:hypothetical protein